MRTSATWRRAGGTCALLLAGASALAGSDVAFDARPGAKLPLDHTFVDERGGRTTIGALLTDGPAIVTPVYYGCPNLCGVALDGIAEAVIAMAAATRPTVIAVSIDPGDDAARAARRKTEILERHPALGTAPRWHLLSGDAAGIGAFADSLGLRFVQDEETGEIRHAAGLVVADRNGHVRRMVSGVRFDAGELSRLLDGNVAGAAPPRALMWCFTYDARTGGYTLAVMNLLRFASIATIVALLACWLHLRRRPTP